MELWQWAQGERPLPLPLPALPSPLASRPAADFVIRNRPYLTAMPMPGDGTRERVLQLREISVAVQKAVKGGASGTEIRRVVEMTMTRPPMPDDQMEMWLAGPPERGGQ
jgi:hypothetical protein